MDRWQEKGRAVTAPHIESHVPVTYGRGHGSDVGDRDSVRTHIPFPSSDFYRLLLRTRTCSVGVVAWVLIGADRYRHYCRGTKPVVVRVRQSIFGVVFHISFSSFSSLPSQADESSNSDHIVVGQAPTHVHAQNLYHPIKVHTKKSAMHSTTKALWYSYILPYRQGAGTSRPYVEVQLKRGKESPSPCVNTVLGRGNNKKKIKLCRSRHPPKRQACEFF